MSRAGPGPAGPVPGALAPAPGPAPARSALRSGSLAPRMCRLLQVTGAFVRMGVRATLSYPLGFGLFLATQVLSVISFVFLAHYLRPSSAIGPSYLAFAAVGVVGNQVVLAGISGLGTELSSAIEQGRMEMLLIEPVSWRVLPVALAVWQILYRVGAALVVLLAAWALGARFVVGGLPVAVALVVLGSAAGVVVGVLAGSVRVLAKRADPVATVYTMAASLLAGTFVPLNVFPEPLRVLAWLLPTTYLNAGLRKAMLPGSAGIYGPGVGLALLLLALAVGIGLPLAVWVFGKSLDFGRRYGVLAGY